MKDIRAKLNSVKKVSIGCFPTPVHRITNFEKELNYKKIYIKRDDLTGVGPGGNKIRCLEYIFQEALDKKADTILVSGPVQSNLCTIAACACRKMNFDCISIFNGDKPEDIKGNMLLDELISSDAHYIGKVTEEDRSKYVDELNMKLKNEGKNPYIIKNGASTGYGAMGYVNAIIELQQQCWDLNIGIKEIFAPGANGGVAAGLIYGNALLGSPFKINIISVEYENKILNENIMEIIKEIEAITDIPFNYNLKNVCNLVDDYRGMGWGLNTDESKEMVFDFPKKEGVFIENIYTSKVLVGMFDLIKKSKVNGSVCFIHTGGFGSLFGQF
ncbi:1-aminocyclopropane-1-carboxylate deaminase/D-cysteine desulfhydrase [Lutispora sp.]|uniref:1-aminocyclopropane-1-carboxylate deaminase/D-cysteine desulfhydrase n=1 Tax=Lutispora sp. TaxID=2828727 RepID=UPI000EC9CC47|nr:pyridoxal-phosphate dependent enzyme [Lutispora sp.]MEA4960581.1 pyridoxal-phosphate dependent enzyme [Lutispora sp.]HCJ56575.1 hypothetical protein [Clostridiaceae bacterium]